MKPGNEANYHWFSVQIYTIVAPDSQYIMVGQSSLVPVAPLLSFSGTYSYLVLPYLPKHSKSHSDGYGNFIDHQLNFEMP